jgi:uncharacterized protein YwgA
MLEISDYVLAVLSAGEGKNFSPVQLQKLFFILDQEIPDLVDGPHFDFKPYDYGPFDSSVYSTLNELISSGNLVRSGESAHPRRTYNTTNEGFTAGKALFDSHFNSEARTYIKQIVDFVLGCNFSELVSAVYKQYPGMKVNSVFNG